MSDGAAGGGGAPGGAAPAGGATGAPPQATQGKATPKAPPKDAAPTWGEKDDADFIERLKRSPYSKLKVNGKDETIDSIDAFKRLQLDAQRGKGANRFVEETKKEAEAAKKEAAEAKAERELIKRARQGDMQARRELGLIPDEERQRSEQEWEALPPEVKQLVQQNHEMAQRLKQREEQEAQSLKERQEAEKKASRDATLKRAGELAPQVLKDVREELYDVELPEILLAMETLKASGARLGVDYTPEQLAAYIEQQREAGVWERVGRAKPGAALKRIAPMLKTLKPNELMEHLGDDFPALAKTFSAAWIAYHKGRQEKAQRTQQTGSTSTTEAPKPRQPLSPIRFQR